MSPRSGAAIDERQRKSVVLPASLGPSTATTWPGSIVNETSSSAGTDP
ncbi:MAG TPA: hypothetical protein VND64_32580 [Pirellulales bacterium]|nr:hypothetical protein [Pirellulales bacterium]